MTSNNSNGKDLVQKKTNVRWMVVALLFIITAINYADRATISIAGPAISKELGLTSVHMGYIFSAFGWAYVIAQLPGGWLLDRFGSKRVYSIGLLLWSFSVMLQGAAAFFTGLTAAVVLFSFRYLDSFLFFSRSTTSRKITNTKRNTTIQKKNKPLLDKLL